MKKEYDFSKGERGKFYRRDVELNIPVYLAPDVARVVRLHARKNESSMAAIVNDWLRKDIRSETRQRRLKPARAGKS